ncbi:hypothetical protein DFJ74DRAFT_692034 [Hyaloraphidium curvatum]|nr:hypothetical protein DFJ74DRAFT_692034 [Hyaloraphidium curvatum]
MMLVPEEVTNLPAQELHAPMRCGTAGPYPCVRCGRPCTTESSFSAYDKLDGCPVYVTLMWPRCRENGGRRGARACVVKRTACCGGGPRDRSRRPGGERRFRGSDGGCGRRHNSHGRRRGWHWGRHWRKGNGASEWRARQCGVGSGRCGRVRSRRSHPRHRELPNRAGGRKAERGGRPLVYSSSPFPSPGEE